MLVNVSWELDSAYFHLDGIERADDGHIMETFPIVKQGQVCSILDAKYRDLWEHDLPAHWLYQLAIYALSQPGEMDATILYPTVESEAREARIAINDPMFGTNRAHVVLRPVNLLYLDQLITGARNVGAGLAPALSFARWLAFGDD